MVAAAIANDGDVMRPYVVLLRPGPRPNLSVLDRTDPQSISKAISSTTADEETTTARRHRRGRYGLTRADPGRRGRGARPAPPSRPATARRTPNSFAPANDPKVAVAVLVQSSDTSPDEIGGGVLGGPIAKSIMEAVITP